MTKLYKKNELTFAIIWIVAYVVLTSYADQISRNIGITKSITALLHVIMTLVLYFWIKKNDLLDKYGLCNSNIVAKRFLYFIPLFIVASSALWNGIHLNYGFLGTLLHVISMCCVGFLEEVIFRGLLFKAMLKDNTKEAIFISAITFGIGHIVNLFNGSGQALFETFMQVVLAIIVGFILVLIFYYGGSLVPCILFHSANNALNAFAVESSNSQTIINIAIIVILVAYLIYLINAFKKKA